LPNKHTKELILNDYQNYIKKYETNN
jgi:hypothetical protein